MHDGRHARTVPPWAHGGTDGSAVACLVLVLAALSGRGEGPATEPVLELVGAEVLSVRLLTPTSLEVTIQTCSIAASAQVEESPTTVQVRGAAPPRAEGASRTCTETQTVELGAPLGGREVVDVEGRAVPVTGG